MKISKIIIIHKKKIITGFIFLVLFISGLLITQQPKGNTLVSLEKSMITVQIKGEVKYFGYYQVEKNTSLADLISLAGGLTINADLERINFNQILNQDMTIVIEKKSSSQENQNLRISINTASASQLMTLKGIGEAKANSIIDYRITNGPFLTIYDLTKVSGISQTILDNIINDICL